MIKMNGLGLRAGLASLCFVLVALIVRFDDHAVVSADGIGQSDRKENLDLPYDAAGESGEEEEAPEIIVFYGRSYEAQAVVFCLDESLSMRRHGRWETQQREIIRAISELSSAVEFGVVFYGDGAHAFRPQLVRASGGNKQAAIAFVTGRQMSFGTCLGPGIVKSLKMLTRAESRHRAVIVAGDGRPTSCPYVRGSESDPGIANRVLTQSRAANVGNQSKVHTILVGTGASNRDKEFMQRLASLHRGTYRHQAQ